MVPASSAACWWPALPAAGSALAHGGGSAGDRRRTGAELHSLLQAPCARPPRWQVAKLPVVGAVGGADMDGDGLVGSLPVRARAKLPVVRAPPVARGWCRRAYARSVPLVRARRVRRRWVRGTAETAASPVKLLAACRYCTRWERKLAVVLVTASRAAQVVRGFLEISSRQREQVLRRRRALMEARRA